MIDFHIWTSALLEFMRVNGFVFAIAGTIYGIFLGAVPGIGPVTALVLVLPLTFGMKPTAAMILLLASYCGSVYGGSLSSILFGIPGTTGSIATCFDGFPLARKGEAGKAIGAATMSSLFGSLFGTVSIAFIGPPLGQLAARISSPAYFMLVMFAFVMVALASREDTLKGLIMSGLGVGVALIGNDVMTATDRYTGDILYLAEGVPFPPTMLGLYAFSQVIIFSAKKGSMLKSDDKVSKLMDGVKEFIRFPMTILRSAVIGLFVGLMPGIGINVSNLLNYMIEKNASKDKESFGKGNIRGVIAPEVGNNATAFGSLSTAFGLGIPGGSTDAIVLAGMIMYGLTPGRSFFNVKESLAFPVIILGMLIASFMFAIVGFTVARHVIKVAQVRLHYLLPGIAAVCAFGAYAQRGYLFDVWVMLFFGFLGYIFRMYNFPLANFVVGMVLGSLLEENLVRSLMFSDGSYTIFLKDIVSLIFFLIILVSLGVSLTKTMLGKKKKQLKI